MILKKINSETKKYQEKDIEKEIPDPTKIKAYNFLELEDVDKTKLKAINSQITYMLHKNSNKRISISDDLYLSLINISDIENLIIVFNMIKDQYVANNKKSPHLIESLQDGYSSYEKRFLNGFTHKVIQYYYEALIKKINTEELKECAELLLKDASIEEIMKRLNINFDFDKKSNIYIISKIYLLKCIETRYKEIFYHHLCADCRTGICECDKLHDEVKKSIDRYDFITDGEQKYSKDGEQLTFRVTGCKKFVKMRDI